MRRIILLIAVAAVMAATMALSGTAFAEPPPQANPSCFGASASALPEGQLIPGPFIGETASGLAGTGTPKSETDEAARNVGLINQIREDVCGPS